MGTIDICIVTCIAICIFIRVVICIVIRIVICMSMPLPLPRIAAGLL